MTRTITNSIAACAAVILALTTIGTIVTVPSAEAAGVNHMIELA